MATDNASPLTRLIGAIQSAPAVKVRKELVISRGNVIRLIIPEILPKKYFGKFSIFRKPGKDNMYMSSTVTYFGVKFGKTSLDLQVDDRNLLATDLPNAVSLDVANLIGKVISTPGHKSNGFNVIHCNERYGILSTSLQASQYNIKTVRVFSDNEAVIKLNERLAPVLTHYGYNKHSNRGSIEYWLLPENAMDPHNNKGMIVEPRLATIEDLVGVDDDAIEGGVDAVVIHTTWDSEGLLKPALRSIARNKVGEFVEIYSPLLKNGEKYDWMETLARVPHMISTVHSSSKASSTKKPFLFFIIPADKDFKALSLPPARPSVGYVESRILHYKSFSVVIMIPDHLYSDDGAGAKAVENAITGFVDTNVFINIKSRIELSEAQLYRQRINGFEKGRDSEHLVTIKNHIGKLLKRAGIEQHQIDRILEARFDSTWQAAYTHISYAQKYIPDKDVTKVTYERLEYLGDAITKSILKAYLIRTYDFLTEKPLTEITNRYLNKSFMARFARQMKVNELIRTIDGKINLSMEEDSYEATFGALYTVVDVIAGEGAAYQICSKVFALTLKDVPIDTDEYGKIPNKTILDQRLERLGFGRKGKFFDTRLEKDENEIGKTSTTEGVYAIYPRDDAVAQHFRDHRIIDRNNDALAKVRGASRKAVDEFLAGEVLKKMDAVDLNEALSYDKSLQSLITSRGYGTSVQEIKQKIGEIRSWLEGSPNYQIVMIRPIRSMELADYVTVGMYIETLDSIRTKTKAIFICTYPNVKKLEVERALYQQFLRLEQSDMGDLPLVLGEDRLPLEMTAL